MSSDFPYFEPDTDATYRLEIMTEITGIPAETILHYQEAGLIQATGDAPEYDDEALRKLRRIEYLRDIFGTDITGLRLILNLMEQVESLQEQLRARR